MNRQIAKMSRSVTTRPDERTPEDKLKLKTADSKQISFKARVPLLFGKSHTVFLFPRIILS
jgi:hypothetical protein